MTEYLRCAKLWAGSGWELKAPQMTGTRKTRVTSFSYSSTYSTFIQNFLCTRPHARLWGQRNEKQHFRKLTAHWGTLLSKLRGGKYRTKASPRNNEKGQWGGGLVSSRRRQP